MTDIELLTGYLASTEGVDTALVEVSLGALRNGAPINDLRIKTSLALRAPKLLPPDYPFTAPETLAAVESAVAKRTGVPYLLNGIEYLVPLTVDDQNTVTAVSVAVMANAIANTVVEFSNGTSMPIAATEWMAFATWFAGERNKLFTGA